MKDKRGRLACHCQGYHFPHRKEGGACWHGPRSDYYVALQKGVPENEALALLSANQLEKMRPI